MLLTYITSILLTFSVEISKRIFSHSFIGIIVGYSFTLHSLLYSLFWTGPSPRLNSGPSTKYIFIFSHIFFKTIRPNIPKLLNYYLSL